MRTEVVKKYYYFKLTFKIKTTGFMNSQINTLISEYINFIEPLIKNIEKFSYNYGKVYDFETIKLQFLLDVTKICLNLKIGNGTKGTTLSNFVCELFLEFQNKRFYKTEEDLKINVMLINSNFESAEEKDNLMFLELSAMMDCIQARCDFTISKKLIDYYFKIAKNILEYHNVSEKDVDKYYSKLNEIFDQPFININEDLDTNTPIDPKTEDYKSFGSGIIISNNGFIVTCYHVIEIGNYIEVEVYTGNNKELHVADVILKDKDNDLALLKIRDLELLSLNQIPFSIFQSTMKVGEGAFALGFPLINTMGYELKVTNGIISAKTGFQNSINQYTISVPLQPGNSGGPLFDYNGNLTGIISAKHSGIDNVSYSIKINYLLSLLDLLSEPIKSQVTNSLPLNDLPKLVDILREYVVLIKVK